MIPTPTRLPGRPRHRSRNLGFPLALVAARQRGRKKIGRARVHDHAKFNQAGEFSHDMHSLQGDEPLQEVISADNR